MLVDEDYHSAHDVAEYPIRKFKDNAPVGQPNPAEYFAPGHVDPGVIGTIASFVTNAGGTPPSQAKSN